ncbi:DUF4365 domain-containing protein [Deinococcus humi]|uniref:DUF4365 domain-containing protein n=1 Tax=Deinococcus humi TaxID=662880 RepID=A0A7W8JSS0_9DEIO|nr:DUF4365 domain-containing protein [Deinococcus humi]MBB5362093.1 hypothetical protein [Deinococcus humi]GGO22101.1 hypothetical protein GCM10008949_09030 [Deinococcus humi]
MLPKPGVSQAQERRGIAAVQSFAAEIGQIWRETSTGDVGIDGQLELVNASGYATGRTVAVQVKAGTSYLRKRGEEYWVYKPEKKHELYWEMYPMPVLLVLHDTEEKISYWTDARQQLRSGTKEILIPRNSILQNTTVDRIFENTGSGSEPFIESIEEILREMAFKRIVRREFDVSYLDLFTHGLTNMCRSLYFGIEIAAEAASYNVAHKGESRLVALTPSYHEFVFSFVRFIAAQNLASFDFSDCLSDWNDYGLQPFFVATLSSRGKSLITYIGRLETHFVENKLLDDGDGLRVAQEGFVGMDFTSYASRIPRINRFQQIYREVISPTITSETTPD